MPQAFLVPLCSSKPLVHQSILGLAWPRPPGCLYWVAQSLACCCAQDAAEDGPNTSDEVSRGAFFLFIRQATDLHGTPAGSTMHARQAKAVRAVRQVQAAEVLPMRWPTTAPKVRTKGKADAAFARKRPWTWLPTAAHEARLVHGRLQPVSPPLRLRAERRRARRRGWARLRVRRRFSVQRR